MGLIFLILFTLAEITLVILTFTKFREKSKWLKNRAIIRAAEAVFMLGIILVPAVNMKWRFFGALIVLAVRLIIAGIVWLVKRKKADGLRQKPRTVISCILSVILVLFSLVPAFIFTNYNGLPTTGKYKVSEVDAILVDESRVDEFENDGSNREIPTHFFYPENADGEYPIVAFSHGAFGYYQSNFSTYAELASNGYVVVALDHPHHSFFTKDTDGKIVTVDTDFIEDVVKINEKTSDEEVFKLSQSWLKLRVDDENFVLDTIKSAKNSKTLSKVWHTDDTDAVLNVLAKTDTDNIGLMGHSLGGASSVALGRERKDIDAVIDLDGTMLGETKAVENGKNVYYSESYPTPVLDFTKESDYNDREQYKNENGYPYVNEYVVNNAKDGKTVIFAGVKHMDFTDLP
ncbi:MAG: dienelactone hydrolase family protein, partial [Ruminococcus sp.]|nr:dienelactone hydrolase family protein [Ruminococcus sp.]